jgi:hypothetical protein
MLSGERWPGAIPALRRSGHGLWACAPRALGHDVLPAGSPLRTHRRPMIFGPDAFGPLFEVLIREIGPGQELVVAPIIDGDGWRRKSVGS